MRQQTSCSIQFVFTGVLLTAMLFLTQFACGDSGIGRFPPVAACTPSCYNRLCGPDGCGGTCGECDGDLLCEPVSGLCLGNGDFSVYGTMDLEYMYGNVQGGRVVVSGPEETSGSDLLVTVVDEDGDVIGADYVDVNGGFDIAVSRPVFGTEKLVFSTLWAPRGEVVMAVLDPETIDNDPGQATFDPYTWYVDVPAGGNVGNVTVSIEDGAGALFVFLMNRLSFDTMIQPVVDRNFEGEPVGLAVMFGANSYYSPCTCYQGEEVTYVGTMKGPKLKARLSVLDEFGGSGAWGWSVLFHEFGHYVLGAYSKDDSAGGMHWIGVPLIPKFAFSEGWATFTSLVTATMWFGTEWPVYWDIQGMAWFYIDFYNGLYINSSSTSEMIYPSLSGSSTQDLDENWVARTLYMIWDGSGSSDDPDATMTLDQMMDTIASTIFLRGDYDGWTRDADLYNFLDSAICLFPEKDGPLSDRMIDEFGFPYAGNPDCPALASLQPDLVPGSGVVRPVQADAVDSRVERIRTPRTAIPPVNLFGVEIDSAVRLHAAPSQRDER